MLASTRRLGEAFVVHLRTDADFAAGRVKGRVEHVESGRSLHFHSAEQLLAFLADEHARARQPAPEE